MSAHQDLEEVYAIWPEFSKECSIPQGWVHIGMSMKGHDMRRRTKLLRSGAEFDITGVTIQGCIRIPYDL